VVITFADITVAKTLEAKLRDKQAALENRVVGQSGKREKEKDKKSSPTEARARQRVEKRAGKAPGSVRR
jgi:hypothetical protein